MFTKFDDLQNSIKGAKRDTKKSRQGFFLQKFIILLGRKAMCKKLNYYVRHQHQFNKAVEALSQDGIINWQINFEKVIAKEVPPGKFLQSGW